MLKSKEKLDELGRAQALVNNKSISSNQISKLTGISPRSINYYRTSPDKLRGASWDYVHKLSELSAGLYLQQELGLEKYFKFSKQVHKLFDKLKEDYDHNLQMLSFLTALEDLIERDPKMVIELAKEFEKQN